jgi:hypothetical protein
MKTNKLEKLLLLEQSGELSPKQRCRLEHELQVSDKARKLRSDLSMLSGSINKPDVELSPWTVARIDARLREKSRPALTPSVLWKPALALAAGLTIISGVFSFHGKPTSSAPVSAVVAMAEVDVWNMPFEEDLIKLENLIVAISDHPADIMEM